MKKHVSNILTTSFFRVPQTEFEKCAHNIQRIFPNERASTYFRPYEPRTEKTTKKQCSGKLWAKYTNIKKVYKFFKESVIGKAIKTNSIFLKLNFNSVILILYYFHRK